MGAEGPPARADRRALRAGDLPRQPVLLRDGPAGGGELGHAALGARQRVAVPQAPWPGVRPPGVGEHPALRLRRRPARHRAGVRLRRRPPLPRLHQVARYGRFRSAGRGRPAACGVPGRRAGRLPPRRPAELPRRPPRRRALRRTGRADAGPPRRPIRAVPCDDRPNGPPRARRAAADVLRGLGGPVVLPRGDRHAGGHRHLGGGAPGPPAHRPVPRRPGRRAADRARRPRPAGPLDAAHRREVPRRRQRLARDQHVHEPRRLRRRRPMRLQRADAPDPRGPRRAGAAEPQAELPLLGRGAAGIPGPAWPVRSEGAAASSRCSTTTC